MCCFNILCPGRSQCFEFMLWQARSDFKHTMCTCAHMVTCACYMRQKNNSNILSYSNATRLSGVKDLANAETIHGHDLICARCKAGKAPED